MRSEPLLEKRLEVLDKVLSEMFNYSYKFKKYTGKFDLKKILDFNKLLSSIFLNQSGNPGALLYIGINNSLSLQ